MKVEVKKILENSPLARYGKIGAGDFIISINGNDALSDLFDYQFEIASETTIILEVLHADGIVATHRINKKAEEDPGILFASPLFTPIKTCNNSCLFCFIDQQPSGLRESLYVKDDDYRLSYFCGTYITLTNLSSNDRKRMALIRPGPLYVSVHSTVAEIREQLMGNKKARHIMKDLKWLAGLDIPFHAQLVICPGINDADSLTQSLNDLASLRPWCLSIAVVPLGLTDYRQTLSSLKPVDRLVAMDVIKRIGNFEKITGIQSFVFASDEFYMLAGEKLPSYDSYGDFPQLEDGVGTICTLQYEFNNLKDTLPERINPDLKYLVVTGKFGECVLKPVIQILNKIDGLYVELIAIENRFWGQSVTVSGLITGQDIINQLSCNNLDQYNAVLIPETMLKQGEHVFLDDYTVEELEQQLNCKIKIVNKPDRAESLINACLQT